MPEAVCPDDKGPLLPAPDGLLTCKRCGGALCSPSELEVLSPGAGELLAPETREESGGWARTRVCPSCGKPMMPLRIARLEAWLERCPSCEAAWVERQDRKSLTLVTKEQARKDAYATFTHEERNEMAKDLAVATASPSPISPFHELLARFGLPVLTRTEGAKTPWMTWMLCLALVAVFLGQHLFGGEDLALGALGYHSDAPSFLQALTACAVHGGVLHLIGNVYFLFAFGDGVEQHVPRPGLLLGFFGLGALAAVAQGWTSGNPQLIFGASGGVEALMGACVVLQPRAKVLIGVGLFGRGNHTMPSIPFPLWLYAAFELLYQTVMSGSGEPGVAWVGHIAGLLLGVGAGVLVRVTASSAKTRG